jgi:hypothetical protein
MGVGGAQALVTAAWLLGVLQTTACASDLVFENGRYHHRGHHYSIASPGGEDSAWRRVEVEGAELVFRGPGRATMSLMEQCGSPPAEPRILAQQLLIGLEGRTLLSEGPVEAGGTPGWMQRIDAVQDGAAIRLKTITRVIGQCGYDWILIVPGELEEHEPVFDRWWESFRSSTSEAGGEAGE